MLQAASPSADGPERPTPCPAICFKRFPHRRREELTVAGEEEGMEGERKRIDVRSLLDTIKSSNVLEDRTSIIGLLRDLQHPDAADLSPLIELLPTLWDDNTCSDISQCTLNKTVLQTASKYLDLNVSSCLSHFLILSTKACMWCRKHLQITIMSFEGASEDEHLLFLLQLIVDSLSFSYATTLALTKANELREKVMMLIIENFVYEQLNLTMTSISEIKKIQLVASEVVKVTQTVLDAVIRLCRKFLEAKNWDTSEVTSETNRNLLDDRSVEFASHVTNMAACTIKNLYDLGILAAAGGGSLVTILNVSWKGVVSLLQCGKNVLSDKVNISDILITLISLANESLRCAAETWLLSGKGELALSEAKRAYLPIKFYLINAVRISSEHPSQAMNVFQEISKCPLLVSFFVVLFSKKVNMRAASEALTDVVEPTSNLLLLSVLNSDDIQLGSKLQILDSLFTVQNDSSTMHSDDSPASQETSFDGLLGMDCDGLPGAGMLMLGRLMIFLNILKSSTSLKDDVMFAISKKLGYVLNSLENEDVYSLILSLCVPLLCGSVQSSGSTWEPLLTSVLHALKAFMIVASSSSMVWKEVENFLVQNLFHSHCLCMDIVVEMWCFFARHAETVIMNDILDKFCSILKVLSSSESALKPLSALRKMARSICSILAHVMQPSIDHVFCSIYNDDDSYASSIMCIALMMEGFPLSSLSDSVKKLSAQKITMAFCGYIASVDEELSFSISSATDNTILLGLPVQVLSSSIHHLRIIEHDIMDDMDVPRFFRFTTRIIKKYKSVAENLKGHYAVLIGAALGIIASMKQFYASSEIRDVVLELQGLFTTNSSTDPLLYECKPMLASFLSGLSHMSLLESDEDTLYLAVGELYHILFREQHWAFIHLSLVAFQCFAAQTSCGELWRFVPDDAALSYDTETGTELNQERFMSQMMVFLQKEMALSLTDPCKDQLCHLVKEGSLLRRKSKNKNLRGGPDMSLGEVEYVEERQTLNKKKRKLPEEITAGILMLQNGLKTIKDGLASSPSVHLKEELSTHISCLEDALVHLVDLF